MSVDMSSDVSIGESENEKHVDIVTFAALEACIAAADKINVHLEELEVVITTLARGKEWLEKTDRLCPKRQTKRSTLKPGGAKPTKEDIRGHIAEAKHLPFDFGSAVARLNGGIASAEQWRGQVRAVLRDLEATHNETEEEPPASLAEKGPPPQVSNAREESTGPLADLASIGGGKEEGGDDDSFPEVDEELLERLAALLKDAELVPVHTEEEAAIERFLALFSWCDTVRGVLQSSSAPSSSSRTVGTASSVFSFQQLGKIVDSGNTLFATSTSPPCEGSGGGEDAAGGGGGGGDNGMSLVLPQFLQPVITFGLKYLQLLNAQVSEAGAWCKTTSKLLSSCPGGVTMPHALGALEAASGLGVQVDEVLRVSKEVKAVHAWLVLAQGALAGEGEAAAAAAVAGGPGVQHQHPAQPVHRQLDLGGFSDLVADGEKLKSVDQSLLKRLRNQVKLAKAWRQKVKKTGLEKGEATTAQLRALLPEASEILVDLSDELTVIKLATSRYCVCRKHSAGNSRLLSCSTCSAQYHSACLGGNEEVLANAGGKGGGGEGGGGSGKGGGNNSSSAEGGGGKFVCGRCSIRGVYSECVNTIITLAERRIATHATTLDNNAVPQHPQQQHPQQQQQQRNPTALASSFTNLLSTSSSSSSSPPPSVPSLSSSPNTNASSSSSATAAAAVAAQQHGTSVAVAAASVTSSSALNVVTTQQQQQQQAAPQRSSSPLTKIAPQQTTHQLVNLQQPDRSTSTSPVNLNSTSAAAAAAAAVAAAAPAPHQYRPLAGLGGGGVADAHALAHAARVWVKLVKDSLFAHSKPPSLDLQRGSNGDASHAIRAPPHMEQYQQHALALGIRSFADVHLIMLCLDKLVWCYVASSLLWGCPTLSSLGAVVARGQQLSVAPNALDLLARMLKRAKEWQAKVRGAVSSKPDPQPFDLALLSQLAEQKDRIPVVVGDEQRRVSAMLEDGGERYCTCRGPSDGKFMIGCDHCDGWFHGKCVGVSAKCGEAIEAEGAQYMCPLCAKSKGVAYAFAALVPSALVKPSASKAANSGAAAAAEEAEDEFLEDGDNDEDSKDDLAKKMHWLTTTLWPPARLLGRFPENSTRAVKKSKKQPEAATVSTSTSSPPSSSSSSSPLSSSASSIAAEEANLVAAAADPAAAAAAAPHTGSENTDQKELPPTQGGACGACGSDGVGGEKRALPVTTTSSSSSSSSSEDGSTQLSSSEEETKRMRRADAFIFVAKR